MKINLKHKLTDLLIFGSLFALFVLAVRGKSLKDPYWLREKLVDWGFIKISDRAKVVTASDVLNTPGAKGLTAGEYEYLVAQGGDAEELKKHLLPGEELME